ncbi:hypothetical protein LY90DRAFT_8446 [Neocallimastix californiae]|jgi:PKD repeat protein|uniref:Uncharacterized protein n=1 Tax=Neocallimastix californiae TaxID=1754190 RepID=A0A1Y2CLP1_9FUNG|nr:hypothetical protein LY90DRAFT_8446 [Neocallimastix californiae]|eukprot:ORY47948.1 hypothetical protein LY90DRAFT_8446 [Neocallimastix californiae]
MLTINSSGEPSNTSSSYSVENDVQNEESEEQFEISEEDISEIEEYLSKEDIDPNDLKNKANKLIQLIKAKERDLLLAAQIGQSLLDANVNMQNQLKMLSDSQNKTVNNESISEINEEEEYYYSSQSPMTTNPRSSSNNRFDEPLPRSTSMRNASTGKKPISDSYDINSYTDNLEEVNYKLQNQVEKLQESLKQNEQQNSKRIVLLENLLEQLQGELSELQVMNRDLESEKQLLLQEKEFSKKVNEMSERDTEKMIAQLFENKNKLVDTVNKLEIKKKLLENELLDAMNGGSKLQNEIKKWKHEAEDCSKYKELYEQELQRVTVLEASLNSYRDDMKSIKAAQLDLNRRSTASLDIDGIDYGLIQSQEQLNDKIKLSEELDYSQGETSHTHRIHRHRVIRRSTLSKEVNIENEEEEEEEENEIITRHSRGSGHHHHHHHHSHLRHIQPLSYDNENDLCYITPPHDDNNVVVLHGKINNIDEEDEEDINGTNSRELVLRDKPCHKCGKIRLNRFNHPKNSRRSRSRVMRARAKRSDIKRKRYSALVPLKSTGEEDEETNTLIQLRNNSNTSFMGIYNTCKQAIENLDYSKSELTRSQSAWKFVQFWFAMLCIFIGCIVVSYRKVFQGTPPSRHTKKTITK